MAVLSFATGAGFACNPSALEANESRCAGVTGVAGVGVAAALFSASDAGVAATLVEFFLVGFCFPFSIRSSNLGDRVARTFFSAFFFLGFGLGFC